MKKLLLAFVLSVFLISTSLGFTRAEILTQLKDLNHQQLEQIQAAQKENVLVKSSLASAIWSNTQLETNKIVLETQIKNLSDWGIDQEKQKNDALTEVDKQKVLVASEKKKVDIETAKAKMAGRERDVFIFLFAILGAYLALSALTPFIKLIPNPIWQFAAWAAAPIGSFIVCVIGIRWIVHFLVNIF